MTDLTKFLDRKSLLADRTEVTDEVLECLYEFSEEDVNFDSLEKFTEKKFKEVSKKEKTELIKNLENADYKKYKNCYISTSKLLFEKSETLVKEIKALNVLNGLGYSVYLLPFGYARNNQNFLQKSADSITNHQFLEFKNVVSVGLTAGESAYKDGRKQSENVFLYYENDINEEIAVHAILRYVNASKSALAKKGIDYNYKDEIFFHFRKTGRTKLLELDKEGFARNKKISTFGLKNIEGVNNSPVVELFNEKSYSLPIEKITYPNSFVNNKDDRTDELDKFADGKITGNHIFNLGKPGEILQKCGFPKDHRIELSGSRLMKKAKQRNHPFDIKDVKGLGKAIQNPVAVFEYGNKAKSQNIIVELQKDGKNFLVGVFFNQKQRGYEVSDIRGLFNKDNIKWLRWIEQGKMIYGDKEKIQVLAAQQRTNLAEVNHKEARTSSDSYYLDSIDSIMQEFGDVKDIYKEKIQVLAAQQRTNLADVNRKEARTSPDSYYLDSVDSIMQKFGDVKDVYTENFEFYNENKERYKIFKAFRDIYQELESIETADAPMLAKEFYEALKNDDTRTLLKYTDGEMYPEIAEKAGELVRNFNLEHNRTQESYGNALKNTRELSNNSQVEERFSNKHPLPKNNISHSDDSVNKDNFRNDKSSVWETYVSLVKSFLPKADVNDKEKVLEASKLALAFQTDMKAAMDVINKEFEKRGVKDEASLVRAIKDVAYPELLKKNRKDFDRSR